MAGHAADGTTLETDRPTVATRRHARAASAIQFALRDFEWVGRPLATVRLLGVEKQDGKPVAMLSVGNRDYLIPASTSAQLIISTVEIIQRTEEERGSSWPVIPTIGALTPQLRYGDAVWVTPERHALCLIGHMFAREVLQ